MKSCINLIHLSETPSTNTFLSELLKQEPQLPSWTIVSADHQTAGRGQRGNSWYATAHLNLALSILLRPAMVPANRQFELSELCALSVLNALSQYISDADLLSIKWPNDIYYKDKKIAGILIEHNLTSTHIDNTILGIGLNINETEYPDFLPNPISLRVILGHEVSCMEVRNILIDEMQRLYCHIANRSFPLLHSNYMQRLYRRNGYHPYRDAEGIFEGKIEEVLPTGELLLMRANGRVRRYAFKEVEYVLDPQ
ncbi:biotin--[acetyl-CoA-carboxylase] ligase [Porphyromonas loveana]|uniref:biotin--[acetyl-CoA-carboxylase] ligase n=1 Tax=Porphyromonas loveana TaxID=1884669 RepID=UPI0035A09B0B